jgi:hypothetical protein
MRLAVTNALAYSLITGANSFIVLATEKKRKISKERLLTPALLFVVCGRISFKFGAKTFRKTTSNRSSFYRMIFDKMARSRMTFRRRKYKQY